MPRKIQISREGTVWLPHMQSYKMIVKAINAQEMPAEIFIKQRLRNFVQDKFEDNFVAVATPTQLEDFPVNSPNADSSFYRVSEIELVGRLPEALDAVFDTLLFEVQKLVQDLNSLDILDEAKFYEIDKDGTREL